MTIDGPARMGRRTFMVATAVLAAGCAAGQPRGPLRLAAGEEGGLYLAFADILAKRLKARYRRLDISVVTTAGSGDNLARLRAGTVDMGIVQADVTEQDRAGGPAGAPLAVARVYEDYLQVVVPSSAAVHQLADLRGLRISTGPVGSGGAITSAVLFAAADLDGRVTTLSYHLKDELVRLSDRSVDAIVWSGSVPTPAIADLGTTLPLRMLDLGQFAASMAHLSGYPYLVLRAPVGVYVPPSLHTIGVPNLLLCSHDLDAGTVAAVVNVLATDAAQLMPPTVRGLQYLDPPSMIQTGLVPLHPGAVDAFDKIHG
jgi:hypothetical protein